jgi:hypothetical protein
LSFNIIYAMNQSLIHVEDYELFLLLWNSWVR